MKNSSIALPTDTRRGSVVAVLATCGDRRKPPPSWFFALPPMTEADSPWPTSRVTFVSSTTAATPTVDLCLWSITRMSSRNPAA